MARQPKPFYRKYTKSWYLNLKGKKVSLGKDKELAFQRYHEIMANQHDLSAEIATCYQLTQVYLDWCSRHRSKGTYENHRRYLKSFIDSIGRRLKIGQLKQKHLTTWLDCIATIIFPRWRQLFFPSGGRRCGERQLRFPNRAGKNNRRYTLLVG